MGRYKPNVIFSSYLCDQEDSNTEGSKVQSLVDKLFDYQLVADGDKIMDVGPGEHPGSTYRLTQECKKRNINAKIISVDPNLDVPFSDRDNVVFERAEYRDVLLEKLPEKEDCSLGMQLMKDSIALGAEAVVASFCKAHSMDVKEYSDLYDLLEENGYHVHEWGNSQNMYVVAERIEERRQEEPIQKSLEQEFAERTKKYNLHRWEHEQKK